MSFFLGFTLARILAAVKYLEDKVALKQSSQSVEIAFWVMIGAQVLMVFQAVWVLVLRISAKNFSLGSITRSITMYCSIFQLGIRSLKTLDGYPIVVAFPCSFFWLSAWKSSSMGHKSLNLSIILGSLGYFGTATVLDRKMRKATILAESPKYDTAKWQESQFVQMMLLLIPIEHSFTYPILIFTIASQKTFHKKTIRSFEKEHIRVAKIDYNKEMNCLLLASVALKNCNNKKFKRDFNFSKNILLHFFSILQLQQILKVSHKFLGLFLL
ncbi:hypothetical protein BY996DRAFT_7852433 [Phakopsora pachyrhizi]|nr:hypothetical protein BY996DRAFT_7852433 [Phakopsora pachyrhizi]